MEERSLGDPPAPSEDEPTVTASEYAAGVRPGRARVLIRHDLHLYPRLQELAEQIETADDSEVDALIDEFDAMRDRMQTTFVVERRSPEWVRETYKRVSAEMGLPKSEGKAKSTATTEQMVEVGQRLLVEQVIEPADFTWEKLRDMTESGAVDVNGRRIDDALAVAVQDVNSGRYGALSLDFSRRRSTTQGKRRSSTR